MLQLPGPTAKLSSKSSKKNESGGEAETGRLIELGRVVGAHGLRGEVRVTPHAAPCPTLRIGLHVRLSLPDVAIRTLEIVNVRTVQKARQQTPRLLLAFADIDSRGEAESLREAVLLVDEAVLPKLGAGEFYHYQLIGLAVATVTSELVGDIQGVLTTPAHDVLVVSSGSVEHLVPVVEDVVRAIDLPRRLVVIDPPPGLLDAAPQG